MKQRLSKDTKLCISIAARPGNFGTSFFNHFFLQKNLDYLYKAMQLEPDGDLKSVVATICALHIQGCSVSMPFKELVLSYLDLLDVTAQKIGAANTIVNQDGKLVGYNTDYLGALSLFEREKLIESNAAVVILGTGGVARALALAARDLKAQVLVVGRNASKLQKFAKEFGVDVLSWTGLDKISGHLLINATPIGMTPQTNELPVSQEVVARFAAVFDVVAEPRETLLIETAKRLGKKAVPGYFLAVEQAIKQFELYTGITLLRSEVMEYFLADRS